MQMTTEVSFSIPEDQPISLPWLQSQHPALTADLLRDLERLCTRVSCPELMQLQKDHEHEIATLRQEHSQQLAVLRAERDAYRLHLEDYTRSEVRRQMDLHLKDVSSPAEASTEEDMMNYILTYYSAKKRLPRNLGDVFPLMSDKGRKGLLANPSLYDSAFAKVKHNHYQTCGKRSRGSAGDTGSAEPAPSSGTVVPC